MYFLYFQAEFFDNNEAIIIFVLDTYLLNILSYEINKINYEGIIDINLSM